LLGPEDIVERNIDELAGNHTAASWSAEVSESQRRHCYSWQASPTAAEAKSAVTTGTHAPPLHRLMRTVAGLGLLAKRDDGVSR
jgi:hypothetical protein